MAANTSPELLDGRQGRDNELARLPQPDVRRSIFVPHHWQGSEAERLTYLEFISELGYLAPDPLFQMLWELRQREVDALHPDRRAKVEEFVRYGIMALPALAAAMDIDAVVAANTEFLLARGADWVYLTACKAVGLIDEIVTYQGLDVLERTGARGPVILAAFHFGPSEMLVGGIAHRGVPVTVVVSDPDRRPAQAGRKVMRASTTADIRSVANGSIGVLLTCLHSLRSNRAVMIFPELSFSKGKEKRAGVPFGGRTIYVPLGIATLAAKTGAAVLPCHVERRGQGRYHCVIGDPLRPGPDLTTELFAHCEALIRDGLAADWEFWNFVPYLLNDPTQ